LKPNLLRGIKAGAVSGIFFAVLMPVNNWLQNQTTSSDKLIVGSVFAFLFFGLIGTFTDKIESEIGDS
jgi:thiamine transporter ThiT